MKLILFVFLVGLALSGTAFGFEVIRVGKGVTFNGKPVRAGQTLKGKGTVSCDVANKGWVDLRLPHGQIVRLRNGEFELGKLQRSSPRTLRVKFGKVFGFLKRSFAGKTIQIESSTATFGIRGTKFLIEVNPEKTYVCVCEGKVAVRRKSEPKKSAVMVADFQDTWIRPGKPIKQAVDAKKMMIDMVGDEFADMGVPLKRKK
jgi:hypothetical protein